MAKKLWSELSKKTQAKYKRQGITPQRYNSYTKKTTSQKKYLNKGLGITKEEYLKSKGNISDIVSFQKQAKGHLKKALKNAEYYLSELRSNGKIPNVDTVIKTANDEPLVFSKIPKSRFAYIATLDTWKYVDWDDDEDPQHYFYH